MDRAVMEMRAYCRLPAPVEHARDIPDDVFRRAVEICTRRHGWGITWYIADGLGVPAKLVCAKAKRFIQRGEMRVRTGREGDVT